MDERIEQRHSRCASSSLSHPLVDVDGTHYSVERAREAVREIKCIDMKQLWTPATVTKLPYPGTGSPPARPGGDIQFVGVEDLKWLVDAVSAAPAGRRVYISGFPGAGKSCRLRALACIMIRLLQAHQKLVCIWSMDMVDRDLVGVTKEALRFAYCNDDGVLEEIDGLATLPDIEAFVKNKCEEKQVFYFIVDGAEALDSRDSAGVARDDSEEKKANLNALLQYGHCCIYGLSPLAEMARKRKLGAAYTMTVKDGFGGAESEAWKSGSVEEPAATRETIPEGVPLMDERMKRKLGAAYTMTVKDGFGGAESEAWKSGSVEEPAATRETIPEGVLVSVVGQKPSRRRDKAGRPASENKRPWRVRGKVTFEVPWHNIADRLEALERAVLSFGECVQAAAKRRANAEELQKLREEIQKEKEKTRRLLQALTA